MRTQAHLFSLRGRDFVRERTPNKAAMGAPAESLQKEGEVKKARRTWQKPKRGRRKPQVGRSKKGPKNPTVESLSLGILPGASKIERRVGGP